MITLGITLSVISVVGLGSATTNLSRDHLHCFLRGDMGCRPSSEPTHTKRSCTPINNVIFHFPTVLLLNWVRGTHAGVTVWLGLVRLGPARPGLVRLSLARPDLVRLDLGRPGPVHRSDARW